jgi:CxxC motif-containing protein (DUF1111 family)
MPEFGCGTAAAQFLAQFVPSARNTPALFGASRLDAATEADLEAAVRLGEERGVSGRIARDASGRPGRFGWKAQTAALEDFVTAACVNELGLSTASTPQPADPTQPEGPIGVDLDADQVSALVSFVASLPAPVPAALPVAGAARFTRAGCTACHQARIGAVVGAYTDLLLHDLGPGLADGGFGYGVARTEEAAEPREWRTPPLWGVADSAPYLHDGRAATLEAAIEAHGGEAEASREAYGQLPRGAQVELLDFLRALGPAPAGPA